MANGLVRSDGKAIAARGDEEGTANEAHRVAVYGLMFKMAEALLDPKSPCAAVWTSTLHQTHSWKDEDLYGLLMIYFMTSYYDGVYPYKHDGLSRYAPLGNLELEHEEDRTEDYRQTSIREREHFGWLKYGCTPPAFLTSALTLVTDPHWLIFHVDLARAFFGWESCWMWHIGGVGARVVHRHHHHRHRRRRHHTTTSTSPLPPSPRQTRSTMASIPMRSASCSGRSTSSPPPRSAPPSSDRAARDAAAAATRRARLAGRACARAMGRGGFWGGAVEGGVETRAREPRGYRARRGQTDGDARVMC